MNVGAHVRDRALAILSLAFLAVAAFSNTIENPFVWDDAELIVNNQYAKGLQNLPYVFSPHYWNYLYPGTRGGYRPITMATFILDHHFWKDDPIGYHITNLVLHLASVILMYLLVSALWRRRTDEPMPGPLSPSTPFLDPPFLSSAFFAANPIHIESVTWIKNRGDILVFIFYAASLVLFMRYLDASKGKNRPLALYAGSIFAFVLSMLSKETAITLPIMICAYVICVLPPAERRRAFLKTLAFFALIALYYIFKTKVLVIEGLTRGMGKISVYHNVLTVFKTLGYYILLLVFPFNLNAERIFFVPRSFSEPAMLFSFVLLAGIAVLIMRSFRRQRLETLAVLWIFITLIPSSNIIFLSSRPIAEQRLYLPSFGFCLLLALVLHRISLWRKRQLLLMAPRTFALTFAALILAAYSIATIQRNLDWKDPLVFWEKTAKSSPLSGRAQFNLGNSYFLYMRLDDALASYQRAIDINPLDIEPRMNTGNALLLQKKTAEAIEVYKKIIAIDPKFAEAYNNLGVAYQSIGDIDEAVKAHEKAIRLEPQSPMAYNNLAVINEEILGRHQEAIAMYMKAIDFGIKTEKIYYNIAIAYSSLERIDEAVDYYKKSIAIKPDFAEAYNNLSVLYYERKDYRLAAHYAEKAKKLGIYNEALFEALRPHMGEK